MTAQPSYWGAMLNRRRNLVALALALTFAPITPVRAALWSDEPDKITVQVKPGAQPLMSLDPWRAPSFSHIPGAPNASENTLINCVGVSPPSF